MNRDTAQAIGKIDEDESAVAHPMRAAFAAKLNPPIRSRFEMSRENLCKEIAEGAEIRLVVVRAAAGYGKTTLLRQLREHYKLLGQQTSWLTLDAAANDISHFMEMFVSCIRAVIGGATQVGTSSQAKDSASLDIIDDVAAQVGTFRLFLDDLDRVQNEAVLGIIREIIDRLPIGSQVIVGTRSMPDIGVARLRAHGQMLEINHSDLTFSLDETTEYLVKKHRLALTTLDVTKLHERTEGWPAALYLTSIALKQRDRVQPFLSNLSNSNAAVEEYLAADVFATQSPEVQEFLLRTSILDSLTPSICDTVLRQSNSEEMIAELVSSNIFLTSLDSEHQTFRYHSLVAEFLHTRLMATRRSEVAGLHKRAAEWFLGQGRPIPAIHHLLQAGDRLLVMELLETHAIRLLLEGRVLLLAGWFSAINSEDLNKHPALRIVYLWVTFFSRSPTKTITLIESLESEVDLDEDTRANIVAIRLHFLFSQDRLEESYKFIKDSLPRPRKEVLDFSDTMLAIGDLMATMYSGHFEEAERLLDQTYGLPPDVSGDFRLIIFKSARAILDLARGRLRSSMAYIESLPQHLSVKTPRLSHEASIVSGLAMAELQYEVDDRVQTARLLGICVPLIIHSASLPDQIIRAYVLTSRLRWMGGEPDLAYGALTELEEKGHRYGLRRVILTARLERSRLEFVQGNFDTARHELDRAADTELWARVERTALIANDVDSYSIAYYRWLIATGDAEKAIPHLFQMINSEVARQRLRRVLKLRILMAEALYLSRRHNESMGMLDVAIPFAFKEGFVRTIADEGPTVGVMLNEWGACRSRDRASGSLAVPDEYLGRLHKAIESAGSWRHQPTAAPQEKLPDLPTRKEIMVLELMAEGLSNHAIAQRLFLSDATVKAHLRNINSKFNADNRSHAVAIARRHGFIRKSS